MTQLTIWTGRKWEPLKKFRSKKSARINAKRIARLLFGTTCFQRIGIRLETV